MHLRFGKRLFACVVAVGLAVVGPAQSVFVAAFGADRVERFLANGTAMTPLTSGLSAPHGLVLGGNGDLYVSNRGNGTIRRFSSAGVDLGAFASGFNLPMGMAFDSAGSLLVAEFNANRVVRVSSAGVVLGTFTNLVSQPIAVAVDETGAIYVANFNGGIRKFSSTGVLQGTFTTNLNRPTAITFDLTGNLLVSNDGSGKVVRMSRDGANLGDVLTIGNTYGVAMTSTGDLFATANAASGSILTVPFGGSASLFASGVANPLNVIVSNPAVVPEPASLLAVGLGSWFIARRRRQ